MAAKVDKTALHKEQFDCFQKPAKSSGEATCPAVWDGYLCWTAQSPSTAATQECPWYINGFNANEKAVKICEESGSWFRHPISNQTWTNYSACLSKGDRQAALIKLYLSLSGFGISIISLLIALYIFFTFRSLKCQRITMHKNLFLSYILNAVVAIIYLASSGAQHTTQVYCKILDGLLQYTQVSNYFWMLCEGIHLHSVVIVAIFRAKQKIFLMLLLGWGYPLIPTFLYIIARLFFDNTTCWRHATTPVLYIVHIPIYVALVMNFGILLNLLRVLLAKLRTSRRNETRSYMVAVRAALILVPLLGFQHILLSFSSLIPNATVQMVFSYVTVILNSCQGLSVAVIFCFCHDEVAQKLPKPSCANLCRNDEEDSKKPEGFKGKKNMSVTMDATQCELVPLEERSTRVQEVSSNQPSIVCNK